MADAPDKKPGILTLPWFKPLYRRVLVCAIPVVGILWEVFYTHDQMWTIIWVAALAYGIWSFFINYERDLAKLEQKDGKPKS